MIDWRATSLADIRDIRLTSFAEASGTLVVAEGEADIPFPIARVFTISGMAPGPVRGSHTLLSCRQVLVCLGGICDVLCDRPYEPDDYIGEIETFRRRKVG